jgi:hypothetical protein
MPKFAFQSIVTVVGSMRNTTMTSSTAAAAATATATVNPPLATVNTKI